jgi:hypothetical protein
LIGNDALIVARTASIQFMCRKGVKPMVDYPKTGIKPLCGSEWLREHLYDHTHEEIESLTIQVSMGGFRLSAIKAGNGKAKKLKEIVRSLK